MDFINSKKIQLVAERYYEKYNNALNSNSDIDTVKKEYSKDVKNNFEQNFTIDKINKIEFDNRIAECIIYYQNLL